MVFPGNRVTLWMGFAWSEVAVLPEGSDMVARLVSPPCRKL